MSETAALTALPPATAAPRAADGPSAGSDGSFRQVMDQVSAPRDPAPEPGADRSGGAGGADAEPAAGSRAGKDGKEDAPPPDPAANPAAALPLAAQLLPTQGGDPSTGNGQAAQGGTTGTAAAVDATRIATDAAGTLKQTLAGLKGAAAPVSATRIDGTRNVSVEKAQTSPTDAAGAKTTGDVGKADGEKLSAKASGAGEIAVDKPGELRAAQERSVAETSQAQAQTPGAAASTPTITARPDRADSVALVQNLPVTHPRFGDAISHQIMVLAQDGVQHAKISLNPADLGPVEVRISLRQDEASVQLAAANGVTRHAIEDALPRLRDMLDQIGVRLGDTGVFSQLPQQGGAEHFGAWRPDSAPLFGPAADLVDETLPGAATTGRAGSGLVDAYV